MNDTLNALVSLGYSTNIMGILRARRDGIINMEEYYKFKETLNLPHDWWRILVFDRS
jgi:hypothetical protein